MSGMKKVRLLIKLKRFTLTLPFALAADGNVLFRSIFIVGAQKVGAGCFFHGS
jgi:hypothetical protein